MSRTTSALTGHLLNNIRLAGGIVKFLFSGTRFDAYIMGVLRSADAYSKLLSALALRGKSPAPPH